MLEFPDQAMQRVRNLLLLIRTSFLELLYVQFALKTVRT